VLRLRRRRALDVDPRTHPRRQPHLSAASGLVRAGARCWVVADDEHHLGSFGSDDGEPLALLRVVTGDLPLAKKARKKLKPDLETLLLLPPHAAWPAGALLALGSGGCPNRRRGVLLPLAQDGSPVGPPQVLEFDALYAPLLDAFGSVNVEGGFVAGSELLLLQRGNDAGGVNAAVRYDAASLLDWLAALAGAAAALPRLPPAPRAIVPYALGAVAGVPLGFTDGAALPDGGWMFSAVAEATDDSYLDGPCAGSVIGFVGPDGLLGRMHLLEGAPKVEGLTGGVGADGRLHLLAVTDADDPELASQLLCADLALSPALTRRPRSP
jgi:hypothetical protein